MAREPRVLGMVLAGGEGKRLWPLTADRAKPAVPFGGNYRLIDFVLSNLVNAGYLRICVLTQYKSHSLDRHITQTWRMSTVIGNYITPVPAQQRLGPRWYTGSADAILQSSNLIYDDRPDYIVVFGADHVYRMDPRQMVAQHIETGAGATVAGIRVPRAEASEFGVIDADSERKVVDFLEKPADPPGLPDSPDEAYASMGNYVFTTEALLEVLQRGRRGRGLRPRHGRQHHADDGQARRRLRLRLQRQRRARRRGARPRVLARCRDARRLLRRAHGSRRRPPDLQPLQPALADLHASPAAAGRQVRRGRPGAGVDRRRGHDHRQRDGAAQRASRRTSACTPAPTSRARCCMDGVQIGRGAVVRRAILDKDVVVPDGAHIGVDPELRPRALPRLATAAWSCSARASAPSCSPAVTSKPRTSRIEATISRGCP